MLIRLRDVDHSPRSRIARFPVHLWGALPVEFQGVKQRL